jgi:uncharacterized protein (DUF2236 family)
MLSHSLTGDPAQTNGPEGQGGGQPLGAGSLTWKLFGDLRSVPLGGRTATLQAMHPAVGAVLWDSSRFREELVDRLLRSFPPILGVVYDDPAQQTGRTVRDFHKAKTGTDSSGRRWHALEPEAFLWVHATFVESMVATQAHFGTPPSTSEKDRLISESPAYWNAYGVRAPGAHWQDWDGFQAYWDHTVDHLLENNATTDWTFRNADMVRPVPTHVPKLLWPLLRHPTRRSLLWITTGLLPAPPARSSS